MKRHSRLSFKKLELLEKAGNDAWDPEVLYEVYRELKQPQLQNKLTDRS